MNSTAKATPIVLTISQLTKAIKLNLEGAFRIVMVKGEVSNLKVQSSGHVYFTLKDEMAQIACVLFFQDAKKVLSPLKMGDNITVRGELTVYEARGNYQIIVREVSVDGLGEQLIKLEQLKAALKAKGYFDLARKKKLPHLPNIIGVVTSETGAVIRDIVQVLTRRLHGFHLILNPVRVQGEGAAAEIAQAIDQLNQCNLVDVIIVGRGGGSFEELSCFNDVRVAKAIFESRIPIVSAVGHETDVTISDLVADVRAPTPSAAAEIVSQEKHKLLENLQKYRKTFYTHISQKLRHHHVQLSKTIRQPLFQARDFLTSRLHQRLDDGRERIDLAIQQKLKAQKELLIQMKRMTERSRPTAKLIQNRQKLYELHRTLTHAIHLKINTLNTKLTNRSGLIDKMTTYRLQQAKNMLQTKKFSQDIPRRILQLILRHKERLGKLASHLESLNPKNLLLRGYSIIFSKETGAILSSTKALHLEDSIDIVFGDGKASATVTSIQTEGIGQHD